MWLIGSSQPAVAETSRDAAPSRGGSFMPALELDFPDYQTLATGAFDAAGDLWLVNADSGRVEEYVRRSSS